MTELSYGALRASLESGQRFTTEQDLNWCTKVSVGRRNGATSGVNTAGAYPLGAIIDL
jgi:hypothetical protein